MDHISVISNLRFFFIFIFWIDSQFFDLKANYRNKGLNLILVFDNYETATKKCKHFSLYTDLFRHYTII